MEYDEILKILAPCGLNCSKCMACADGDIKKHSRELKRLLGSFDSYAERFSNFIPVFKHYLSFKELLDYFAQADCKGCRQGDGKYPDCGIAQCYKDKNVDFCFQCNEFPCDKSHFDPNLKERWIKINNRLKEIGVGAYVEETKDLPRYI